MCKKETFFKSTKCQSWLEKELPTQSPPLLPTVNEATPNIVNTLASQAVTPVVKPKRKKPFQSLSERGKRKRLQNSYNLKPEELEFFLQKTKKRRLDLLPENQRKSDNKICLHYFCRARNFG